MDPTKRLEALSRLHGYLDGIGSLLSDKRQRACFALIPAGLLNDGERKSMEPLAARASGDPESCSAVHHRLIHFLSSAAWRDEPIRDYTTGYAIAEMQTQAPINAWIVDDTGFLKQGRSSPGVQRQYTDSATLDLDSVLHPEVAQRGLRSFDNDEHLAHSPWPS